jgi:hypothetical protein
MRRVVTLLVLAACADVTTPEEYVEIVEGSRACAADGECVLAGSGACTCAAPVNAAEAARVDEAAAEVDCKGATVECPSQGDVRCNAGRCVSAESP